MKAKFYLHPDNLKYDSVNPKDRYYSNLDSLIKDLAEIVGDITEENRIICHTSLYSTEIADGMTIYDVIFREGVQEEEKAVLLGAISKLADVDEFDLVEVYSSTGYERSAQECHVPIVINRPCEKVDFTNYMQFDTYELVYDKCSWRTVRRQILGNHPENAESFMKRAKAYFPNLMFSDNCERVVGEYLETVPRKMVYYLSCMNDHLWNFWNKHPYKKSEKIYCADFAGQFGMDRTGSPESQPAKKGDYTFEFVINGHTEMLCCDPHFKGTHVDENCNVPGIQPSDPYHSRIYFAINESGVYVGSIGPHI